MLILCSNGLTSPELIQAAQQHLGNSKNAALVVTADHIYKEENHHVRRCQDILEELGNQYSPEINFMGMADLRGLGLTQVQVLPHYSCFFRGNLQSL